MMGFVGDWIGELYEETIGRITGEKDYGKAVEMARDLAQKQLEIQLYQLGLQRQMLDQLMRGIPFAQAQIAGAYDEARQSLGRSLGRMLGQAQIQQNVLNRYLNRVGATGFLSAGALEQASRASSEALGQALLGMFSELGVKDAELALEAGLKSAFTPLEFMRVGASLLGAGPSVGQNLSVYGSLIANRPPSLFDRLFQIGTAYLLLK